MRNSLFWFRVNYSNTNNTTIFGDVFYYFDRVLKTFFENVKTHVTYHNNSNAIEL